MSRPNVCLAMGYGEEKCQKCRVNDVEVVTENPAFKVCKPCTVEAIKNAVKGT